ncbi:hypothetical protein BC360_25675 [Ensifer sp. LC163]|nr:hypothetical protein BC360_25675 [Ensifer sp. LC163]
MRKHLGGGKGQSKFFDQAVEPITFRFLRLYSQFFKDIASNEIELGISVGPRRMLPSSDLVTLTWKFEPRSI